jgi:pimeloyl-ACP methyl ester carboxylesterase
MLVADGWDVYTPSLTGMGDRAHLLSPDVGLETHVQDVVGIVESQELTDIVLCGHSAGGIVVTAVADRIPDRIGHLIYLDAAVPENGQSLMDVLGDAQGVPDIFRKQAIESGIGWQVPPILFNAAAFGVEDSEDAAWLERRMGSHPLRAFEEPAVLSGGIDAIARKTYIRCERFPIDFGPRMVSRFDGNPGWQVECWDSAHDVMITEPARVRNALVA